VGQGEGQDPPNKSRVVNPTGGSSGVDVAGVPAGAVYGNVQQLWIQSAETAKEDKRTYQEKLETAGADDVFKYVFLISSSAVEQYVSQSRIQAEKSFELSRRILVAGFVVLLGGIGLGVLTELTDNSLSVAYLAGIGGVLTEFVAGTVFWLYNRTLQQINAFYQGMMKQQQEALARIGQPPPGTGTP
jgi:Cyanobacterial TRADD-N associated 2-Transmembrane domain